MRRGRLLILIGLILACGTAAIVFVLLQNMQKMPETTPITTEEVVIAAQPIEEGQPTEGRLAMKAVDVNIIPGGALRSLDGTTGLLTKIRIDQGTIVTSAMLETKEEQMARGQVGQLVEPGYVAMAFPISELSSVSYGVQPNDLVDIMVTFVFVELDTETQSKEPLCPPICPAAEGGQASASADQIPRYAAQLTLQKVRVLGVGRWQYMAPTPEPGQQTGGDTATTAGEPPQYITLMLAPQDALVLKLAREHKASIDLAIRSKDDTQDFATQQVTLEYILSRFGVSLPEKQEYTIEGLAP